MKNINWREFDTIKEQEAKGYEWISLILKTNGKNNYEVYPEVSVRRMCPMSLEDIQIMINELERAKEKISEYSDKELHVTYKFAE